VKLNFPFIKSTSFYFSFFEKQNIPDVCSKIEFNDAIIYGSEQTNTSKKAPNISVLKLVPAYFNLHIKEGFYSKKLYHKPGLAAKLDDQFVNIEEYLRKTCDSRYRKNITRSVRRFENCFNANYKMFFGNISKEESSSLMGKLYRFIENRFKQRSGRNTILRNWSYYKDLAFNGINNGKASLYVVYNNNVPVDITLSFHHKNIMFSFISSYDIDYSKFGIGNIGNYKQIEWCIENEIALYDIGFGIYDNKRRITNFEYNFESIYVSRKNNILFKTYTFFEHFKDQVIHYLILKKVNYWFHDTVDKIKGIDTTYVPRDYDILSSNKDNFDSEELNIKLDANFFLRKPVFDLIYNHQEHIDQIKVYKSANQQGVYKIKGKAFGTTFRF
jgi:hypothetical protein